MSSLYLEAFFAPIKFDLTNAGLSKAIRTAKHTTIATPDEPVPEIWSVID
jgi:hypothetical protein